ETVRKPMISTSRVVKPRWVSTLSVTTWKNSGVTSANNCRKKEATITSPNRRHRLQEPGDVEAPGEVAQLRPTRHQHQMTGPFGFELSVAEQLRATTGRALHEDALVHDLRQDQEGPVAQCRDGGQRQVRQA